jgi:hypothetical protein
MPDPASRKARRDRQSVEVEESQQKLRDNIEQAKQLLDDSEQMLKRHRKECEDHGD